MQFEARITTDLIEEDSRLGWRNASRYSLDHIATHAAAGGQLEKLLADLEYVEEANADSLANACLAYATTIDEAFRQRRVAVQQGVRGTQPGETRVIQLAWFGAIQRDGELVRKLASRPVQPRVLPSAVVAARLPDVDRTLGDLGGILSVATTSDPEPRVWALASHGQLGIWTFAGTHIRDVDGAGAAFKLIELQTREGQLIGGLCANGSLRSWTEAGEPAPLQVERAHAGWILGATVVRLGGDPVLLTAGADGAVRSWTMDGRPGPFLVERAHNGWVRAVVVVDDGGSDIVVTVGGDRAVRSWRLDGTQGDLDVRDAHVSWILDVLAVRDHVGAPLLVTVGDDRAIRSWYTDG